MTIEATTTGARDSAALADTYLKLFERRQQLLAEVACIERMLPHFAEKLSLDYARGPRLPKSGLRIVASQAGSFLCKGGPAA